MKSGFHFGTGYSNLIDRKILLKKVSDDSFLDIGVIVGDKRARYLQKRKKKLREKLAQIRLEEDYVRTLRILKDISDQEHAVVDEDSLAYRIIDLTYDVFPEIQDERDFRNSCEIVILAWNVSVGGEDLLSDSMTPRLLEIMRGLAERKKEVFPEDNRLVAEYYWEADGTTLVVDATMAI